MGVVHFVVLQVTLEVDATEDVGKEDCLPSEAAHWAATTVRTSLNHCYVHGFHNPANVTVDTYYRKGVKP